MCAISVLELFSCADTQPHTATYTHTKYNSLVCVGQNFNETNKELFQTSAFVFDRECGKQRKKKYESDYLERWRECDVRTEFRIFHTHKPCLVWELSSAIQRLEPTLCWTRGFPSPTSIYT